MENWKENFFVEFEFYRNFSTLNQELTDLLKENEMNIQLPMTRYEDGQMFYGCPTTEDQVINKIRREESLKNLQNKAQKRVDRLLNALEQLNEDERTVLYYLEMKQGYLSPEQLLEECGVKNTAELMTIKETALANLSRIYSKEREGRQLDYQKMLLEERKEQVRKYIS